MTKPAVMRIFFAVALSEELKDKVGKFINELKKKARTNAIRWSKPANLHITLQFLAEVQTAHLPSLLDKVKLALVDNKHPLSIKLSNINLLPDPHRPRVIVLDISPQQELAELSKLIGQGIQAANYPIEDRPFRGHLTLGRIKHAHGVNLAFLSEVELLQEIIEVGEVTLYRSEPQPEGSHYTILEQVNLTKTQGTLA